MNKKLKEVALHEKDTGSSEVQIALLTEKIETLSKHIKQFELPTIQCLFHAKQLLLIFCSFFSYLFVCLIKFSIFSA